MPNFWVVQVLIFVYFLLFCLIMQKLLCAYSIWGSKHLEFNCSCYFQVNKKPG